MPLQVTGLYAALLCLIGLALTLMVGAKRAKTPVSLGDGGDKGLLEAMRRQANWVENVPYVLILFAIIELNGAPQTWLHTMGAVLVVSRVLHPIGIDAGVMMKLPRFVGMLGTLLVALAAITTALWQQFG